MVNSGRLEFETFALKALLRFISYFHKDSEMSELSMFFFKNKKSNPHNQIIIIVIGFFFF